MPAPRLLANGLLVMAALCLAAVGYVQVETRWLAVLHRADVLTAEAALPGDSLAPGTPVAWIRVPRLGVSALVREGIEGEVLRASVGHLPRTALPGAAGNVVLAGHRDSFFKALEEVRIGDRILLAAPGGSYEYRVISTAVVAPQATNVLRASGQSLLTLVTCYPFRYVGPAPRRFVVQAVLAPEPRIG